MCVALILYTYAPIHLVTHKTVLARDEIKQRGRACEKTTLLTTSALVATCSACAPASVAAACASQCSPSWAFRLSSMTGSRSSRSSRISASILAEEVHCALGSTAKRLARGT
eukprot:6193292-Pleurochrysis_carterae.AAC.1